nr:unnamed protein product [Callosobruchus chinensis]
MFVQYAYQYFASLAPYVQLATLSSKCQPP